MNVDFNSCINNWCYQNGTRGQYTRCKSVSNNGRTCHYPEIRYGYTVGGKPGFVPEYNVWKPWKSLPIWKQGRGGATEWCRQLFPTTLITRGFTTYKVIYYLIVILLLKVYVNPHEQFNEK